MPKCMTPAGVMYISMYHSCRSQESLCMTPAGVMYLNVLLLQESSISMYDTSRGKCIIPAGAKYLYVFLMQESCISMYGSCRCNVSPNAQLLQESSISMYDSCRSRASLCMTPAGVKYLYV